MSDTTTNYGIQKPSEYWLDQHPGVGVSGMVSEALDNVDKALSGGAKFRTVSLPVSSDQLLNMKATPVEIVPAMAGCVSKPLGAVLQYIPVSVDYTLGDATSLYIGTDTNPLSNVNVLSPIPATVLDGSDGPGNVIGMFPSVNVVVTAQSWFDNHAIVLTHDGTAELTLGDGMVVISLVYIVVEV